MTTLPFARGDSPYRLSYHRLFYARWVMNSFGTLSLRSGPARRRRSQWTSFDAPPRFHASHPRGASFAVPYFFILYGVHNSALEIEQKVIRPHFPPATFLNEH